MQALELVPENRRKTILLVHERAMVRSTFAEELRSLGFDVLEAADGLSALRQAYQHPGMLLDAVIVDATSHAVAGTAVARRLQDAIPSLATLMLGADAVPSGLSLFNTSILPRPFSKVGFLAAVHALFN